MPGVHAGVALRRGPRVPAREIDLGAIAEATRRAARRHVRLTDVARAAARDRRRASPKVARGILDPGPGAHGPAPRARRAEGPRITPLFAPGHGSGMEFTKLMARARARMARARMDASLFAFARRASVDARMIAPAGRRAKGRVVPDQGEPPAPGTGHARGRASRENR